MDLHGGSLIGSETVSGSGEPWQAVEAATGNKIGPRFTSATPELVDRACTLANETRDTYRETASEIRAA